MKRKELVALKLGSRIYWNNPNGGQCSRWIEIYDIEIDEGIVCITDSDGSYIECHVRELSLTEV